MNFRKLALLAALYLCQGLPYGFFVQALPVLLRRQGVSLEAIGLSSLLALPWALKFLWAPLVDRRFSPTLGRRRSWLLPLQGATAVALAALAFWSPGEPLRWLLAGIVVINLLSATQDIATDGLALDLLRPEERGLANGVQVAGYRAGMIVGGGALLILFERLGWARSFFGMAALVLLLSVPVLLHRETPPEADTPQESEEDRSEIPLRHRPEGKRIFALLVIYKLGEALAVGMLRPWMVDQGVGLEQIGWILGTAGFLAGLLGALLGGALVPRLGRRLALELFATLQALALAGYVIAATRSVSTGTLTALCAVEHLTSGMATAALFTAMMDWSSRKEGASDYTAQASAVVIATGVASAVGGVSAARLGYAGHFGLACLLSALVPLAVRRLG